VTAPSQRAATGADDHSINLHGFKLNLSESSYLDLCGEQSCVREDAPRWRVGGNRESLTQRIDRHTPSFNAVFALKDSSCDEAGTAVKL
jgi:hypothetical protein